MKPLEPLTASLLAGAGASLVSLLVFLAVHHVWIKPIWFIAPPGALIAVIGGLAVGWMWFLLEARLPSGWLAAPALFGLIMGVLLPAILLSFTHGPLFDLATATIPPGQGKAVAVRFVLELLLTAMITGAVVGALLGRSPTAALATGLAGLAFAAGPGHNVPMFGSNPAAFKGIALLVIISVALAIAFVQINTLLRRP